MNRETRDKFAKRTDQTDLTSGNACWQTAPKVFAKLEADFGPFDVDICGDTQRALKPVFFGPGSTYGEDALMAKWTDVGSNGFCNPPYGPFVASLLAKAKAEAAVGMTSTHLLPMRVTRAFHAHILNGASDLLFCDKRLVFFEDDVPRLNEKSWREKGVLVADTAMFDSIIVRFTPGHRGGPNVGAWSVPEHVSADDLARAERRLIKMFCEAA